MDENVMRHQYYPLSETNKAKIQAVKDASLSLYQLIDQIGRSRELSLAKTHLEEAVMWATKHLTRWQPLPSVGTIAPPTEDSPTFLTLTMLRAATKAAERYVKEAHDQHIAARFQGVVLVHTDLEPDCRDIPGFIPEHQYSDAQYEEEFGRCERLRFAAHPDLPSFGNIYPVVIASLVNGEVRHTALLYVKAREL